MALLDLFKKKKAPVEKEEDKKPVKETKEPKKEVVKTLKKKKKKIGPRTVFVLKSPHITEKATDLIKKNQYTFKVSSNSNKTEIKKEVEQLYNVDVLSVKTMKVPKKITRVGKTSGWSRGYKKAIVKIKEGQKSEELIR